MDRSAFFVEKGYWETSRWSVATSQPILNSSNSICDSDMLSKTKVSKGYLTVVPKKVREASEIREGDLLEWSIEEGKIVIRPRPRRTVKDVTGIISHGGDAVESKHRAQRGR